MITCKINGQVSSFVGGFLIWLSNRSSPTSFLLLLLLCYRLFFPPLGVISFQGEMGFKITVTRYISKSYFCQKGSNHAIIHF